MNNKPKIYNSANHSTYLDPLLECELADLLEKEILFHRLLEK